MILKKTPLKHIKKLSFGKNDNDNRIIKGDNKLVLNHLKEEFKGKVKCIYIDPPYNNGENFNHYDDSKNHQNWLQEIRDTLIKLKDFLQADGSIWISIDDKEMHYLKVIADEVFERKNFISTIVWQHRVTRENRKTFSNNHEYILVYAISPQLFKAQRNLLPLTEEVRKRYKNPDNDHRGEWQSISANVQDGHATKNQFYNLVAPNGKLHFPPNGRCWIYNKEKIEKEIKENNIWFGRDGNGVPRVKKFLNGSAAGLTPETLWLGSEVGTTQDAKKHILQLFEDQLVFDTPKPEQLIERILQICTNQGDLILDCYLGSGSTISTAHKMNRKYIGVEIGDHIIDYAVARIKKVILGEAGGISSNSKWKGGGGYDFYELK